MAVGDLAVFRLAVLVEMFIAFLDNKKPPPTR